MTLAEVESRVCADGDLGAIAEAYLHRAVYEDGGIRIAGRDWIIQHRIGDVPAGMRSGFELLHDLGDMIVCRDADGRRRHVWAEREAAWIARIVMVVDGAEARALPPCHVPLGELSCGRGQFSASEAPLLPNGFPDAARAAAERLHRLWNGRDLTSPERLQWQGPGGRQGDGSARSAWAAELLSALPDATLLIERGLIGPDGEIAILWRLHGNHLGEALGLAPTGRRIRIVGSSVLANDGEDSLIDGGALLSALKQDIIDYAAE